MQFLQTCQSLTNLSTWYQVVSVFVPMTYNNNILYQQFHLLPLFYRVMIIVLHKKKHYRCLDVPWFPYSRYRTEFAARLGDATLGSGNGISDISRWPAPKLAIRLLRDVSVSKAAPAETFVREILSVLEPQEISKQFLNATTSKTFPFSTYNRLNVQDPVSALTAIGPLDRVVAVAKCSSQLILSSAISSNAVIKLFLNICPCLHFSAHLILLSLFYYK